MLLIKVGYFINQPEGSRDRFDVEENFVFQAQDEVTVKGPVKTSVHLTKLPHEISVHLEDLETVLEAQCNRCLMTFEHQLHIPSVERQFIIDDDKHKIGEDEDVFYVNTARNEIDLKDMIREEILLHFPEFPLCSESCKGLCSTCGANMNSAPCKHRTTSPPAPWQNIQFPKKR